MKKLYKNDVIFHLL